MIGNKFFFKRSQILCFILLCSFLTIYIGCGSGFHVSNITVGRADWVNPPAGFKATIIFRFNRSVAQSSLNTPGTVQISVTGTHDGRTVSNITGTFIPNGTWGTASEIAFVTDKTLSELINPQAGENIEYSIKLIGTSVGAGGVTDANGEGLDGDENGTPGGNYTKVIMVVG